MLKNWVAGMAALGAMSGSTIARASNFQDILSCSGGSAVVQVNLDERRELKLVIAKDEMAVDYLSDVHTRGSSPAIFWDVWNFDHDESGNFIGRLEATGRANDGVFSNEGFHGFLIAHPRYGTEIRVLRNGETLNVNLHYTGGMYDPVTWAFRECR